MPPRSPSRPSRSRPDDVPGLPARRAALRLLDAALRRGEPLELALHGAAQGLPREDRALTHVRLTTDGPVTRLDRRR